MEINHLIIYEQLMNHITLYSFSNLFFEQIFQGLFCFKVNLGPLH